MAVDTPIITRNRVFAAKTETTTGTAIAISGSDGVFNCFDPKMEGDIPNTKREGQGSLSHLASIPEAYKGKFTFKTEAFGSGTPGTEPSWATTLLPAAGFQIAAGVCTPKTGGAQPTLTIGHYVGGRLFQLAGASLDLTIKGKRGEPLYFEWSAQGVWQAPTSVALITPTYPTTIPPRFAGATFTIGGTSYKCSEFTMPMNNKLYLREDFSAVAGYRACCIVDRDPQIKVDPEALPLGTQNWFAGHLAGTTYAFSLAVGAVSGNIITIAAPVAQQMEVPKLKDRSGIQADDLSFQCNANSAGGDDEISISF